MSQKNEISLNIPADLKDKISKSIQALNADLRPILVSLTPEQRHLIPKMGDKTLAFVKKTAVYAVARPQFVPAYMNVDDMNVDIAACEALLPFLAEIETLHSALEDTIMLSGSEAYIAALMYYRSVKTAAENNIQDAKDIANDLGERFPGYPRKAKPVDPPTE